MSEAPDLLAALGRSVEKAREARQADSRIYRAARVLSTAPWDDLTVTEQVRWLNAATRLDAAGLLASPAHDAAAAARAVRDAVEWMDENTPDGVMVTRLQVFDFLNDYADRIEREGGAS